MSHEIATVTASAPGRVNLIGEHLDYNGGCCLPIAIDRRTTVSLGRAASASLRSEVEPAGWERYVLGVLRALGVQEPLEIAVTSDVPIGAGLSSSAALECATALAVDELLGLGRTHDELVRACVRAENEYVGVPTGGLDQTTSFHARAGRALLLDFATGGRSLVGFDPGAAGLALVVIDTRVHHRLVDGGYAARRAECVAAAAALGIEHLALADPRAVRALADDRLRARATHVVSEQARVRETVTALAAGRWYTVGAMMTSSHASLRDHFEVSCPELDTAVASALAAGARGARMTGGGFGGSAIALVPEPVLAAVTGAVEDAFARNGWKAPTVFPVEASRCAELEPAT